MDKIRKNFFNFIITLCLGYFGVHKFMKKDYKMGIIYFLTIGLFGIGWIIDTIVTGINLLKSVMNIENNEKVYNNIKKESNSACQIVLNDSNIDNIKSKFIAFDIETTGLNPYYDRIIELGAVVFENGVPISKFSTLVNPETLISQEASKINHITNDMLKDAPSENEVYKKFIEFMKPALNSEVPICAHNALFDISFITNTLNRLGYNYNISYIDTLSISRNILDNQVINHKQDTIAKYFNIVNEEQHRAVTDAETCGKILDKLISLLSNEFDKNAKISSKEINNINKDYKLPSIDIISCNESKNIVHFIEKMKTKKGTVIPIGIIDDNIITEKINSMPNLLIGGTVMSGKTSYINAIISSILFLKKPNEVKLMIYDSKNIDYSIYNGIPHLITPIISDSKKLFFSLQKVCNIIDDRREKLSQTNTKNIDIYNIKVAENEKIFDLIVIIDDFNSFNISDETNELINYITTNGWYVNVFVIISSNHPSAKIIPTISKANFPARISFKVINSSASKIIINESGAEKLSGYGTALYTSRLNNQIQKIKVPFITDEDINNIVEYWHKYVDTSYSSDITNQELHENNLENYDDPMYNEVVEFAIMSGKISTSLIQRKFRFGFNRAARMIDLLESRGIVGPQNGSEPRKVLLKSDDNKIGI